MLNLGLPLPVRVWPFEVRHSIRALEKKIWVRNGGRHNLHTQTQYIDRRCFNVGTASQMMAHHLTSAGSRVCWEYAAFQKVEIAGQKCMA